MIIHKLEQAMSQDKHLQHFKDYIIQGWPESRDQILQDITDIRTYWMFRDDITVINEVIINGRHTLVLQVIQKQALQQLHMNQMAIEITELLVQLHLLDRYEY